MANETVHDQMLSFSGGQNASKTPDKIGISSYYSGVNLNCENDALTGRYGFEEHTLTFALGGITLSTGFERSYENIFTFGKFQALIPYQVGEQKYLIVVVSGVIFLINETTWTVSVIEIADGSKLDEHAPRINWTPGGRFLVLFDYPAFPVIIEGVSARRSDPTKMEIPISRLGTYNQSRIIIANGGDEFTASDAKSTSFPDAPITFEEVETPSGDYYEQIFELNTDYNNEPITNMTFLPVIDNSTGIGPCLISTKKAIYSYHTEYPRAIWETAPQGFGSIFIPDAGIAGQRSSSFYGSNIIFLDSTGRLRSASMSRSQQTQWSKVPLSREVQNYLIASDPDLFEYSVVCYFNNKIFVFANPYRVVSYDIHLKPVFDYVHGGMVVLGLDNVSTFTEGHSPPAWDGLWTGIRPMDMVVNDNRAFIISKDGGQNKIFELRPDIQHDLIGPDKANKQVVSKLYTREMDCGQPFVNKELSDAEFYLANLKGDFKMDVKYKTSQTGKFLQWKVFEHYAPWQTCRLDTACGITPLLPHEIRDLNIGGPLDYSPNDVTRGRANWFRKIQLFITITGISWEIRDFMITAINQARDPKYAVDKVYDPIEVCSDCITDWDIEDEDICQKINQAQ